MGTLALIVEGRAEGFALDPSIAARLSGLGITRVSMLRDEDSVAVVLEGWAFDPDRSGRDAEVALLGRSGDARFFLPVAQVNLANGSRQPDLLSDRPTSGYSAAAKRPRMS